MINFTRTKYLTRLENAFKLYNLVYLTGTRQVWKTTLWKSFLKDKNFVYLSLDTYNLKGIQTTTDFLDYFKIYHKINLLDYDRFLFWWS